MISAGGADPGGITEKLMIGVCSKMPAVEFHFVVGALNPRIEKIEALAKDNITLHINEQNMSGLMQKCDVYISCPLNNSLGFEKSSRIRQNVLY